MITFVTKMLTQDLRLIDKVENNGYLSLSFNINYHDFNDLHAELTEQGYTFIRHSISGKIMTIQYRK